MAWEQASVVEKSKKKTTNGRIIGWKEFSAWAVTCGIRFKARFLRFDEPSVGSLHVIKHFSVNWLF